MAFRQGFLIGAALGALVTILYTPIEGRDARAIILGPLGWREEESEPNDFVDEPRNAGRLQST
ncbi:MAG: YtxH domain-containing protein [Chloroflexota bacterium]|nr:MAG: YtxH domain-containing protein [Chloroflexota bacterium]